jgi:hypothetical protein
LGPFRRGQQTYIGNLLLLFDSPIEILTRVWA